MEPWDLAETCSLDVAERGGCSLKEVGLLMNLTRERVRQVEVRARTSMCREVKKQESPHYLSS